jgi:hypothetical protein
MNFIHNCFFDIVFFYVGPHFIIFQLETSKTITERKLMILG